ncbi:MAG: hypothetical protein MUO50_16805, partial [Longimicrobiales bacterium]|nr:hypothetical protein [Longimicrobiales bacterium]
LELETTYPEGFSFLNGVRELSDGSLLAADPLAQLLLRIDLNAATADTLGRVGPGPQEYKQPDQVFPLPGDSSLLVDLGKAQLMVIDPDGSFRAGLSMMVPREGGSPEILHPRFVDSAGNLYHQASRSRTGGPADSAAVTRFSRSSSTFDTVATIWLPENSQVRTQRFGFLPRMLEPGDDWAVGPDGRVAVIRAEDFSVEWTLAGGRKVLGPPHEFETWSVSREDKEAQMAEMRNSAISSTSMTSRSGGIQSLSMSRGIPNSGDGPGVDDFEWASTFPAFRNDRTLISPRGEAWVERWVPVGSDSRWEVFDDEGIWSGSVVLPPRHQILGFGRSPQGAEVAYLTWADEYDLKWLERYRIIR